MASSEVVDVLDEAGQAVMAMPRDEVHRQGLLHRCVHVFVLTPEGKLWLQKRDVDRRLYPGLWTSSASGHVEAGEDEGLAARREVLEEVGLEVEPRRLGEFRFRDEHENELASLWEARSAARPRPQGEVIAVMAVGKEELAALRARLPGSFAPSFLAALKAYGWM